MPDRAYCVYGTEPVSPGVCIVWVKVDGKYRRLGTANFILSRFVMEYGGQTIRKRTLQEVVDAVMEIV